MLKHGPLPDAKGWHAIVAEYASGKSPNQICKDHGLARTTVRRYLKRHGAVMLPRRQACARHALPIDHHAFENAEQNADAAYWIGMMATDGNIHKLKHGTSIQINLSGDDRHHVDKFRTFLKSERKIAELPERTHEFTRTNGTSYVSVIQPTKLLNVSSHQIANTLLQYGITPRKSKTLKIQKLEFNKNFWRGAMDGDGAICALRNGQYLVPIVSFVSGSQEFAKQFEAFVKTICQTLATARQCRTLWQIQVKGHCAVQIIHALYHNCVTALPRKKAMADMIMAQWPLPVDENFANKRIVQMRMKAARLAGNTIF